MLAPFNGYRVMTVSGWLWENWSRLQFLSGLIAAKAAAGAGAWALPRSKPLKKINWFHERRFFSFFSHCRLISLTFNKIRWRMWLRSFLAPPTLNEPMEYLFDWQSSAWTSKFTLQVTFRWLQQNSYAVDAMETKANSHEKKISIVIKYSNNKAYFWDLLLSLSMSIGTTVFVLLGSILLSLQLARCYN